MDYLRFLTGRFMPMLEEDGGAGGGTTDGGSNNSEGENNPSSEKTFTQEQVNSMLAAEKRKNQNSVYKDLGFENADKAKEFITKHKEAEEKAKDDLTKAKEAAAAAEKAKDAEIAKTRNLEFKIKVIEAGGIASYAEDIVTLVGTRMTEDKDFEAVLKEIKETYPSMFENSPENKGTGSGGGNQKRKSSGGSLDGIGKRIAESKQKTAKSNFNYFKS